CVRPRQQFEIGRNGRIGLPKSCKVFPHKQTFASQKANHLRPPDPKPGALKTELHSEKNGGPEGSCTLNPPADNGALCWLSYESYRCGINNAKCRRPAVYPFCILHSEFYN